MAHLRSIGSAAMLAAACWWINAPRIAAQQGPVAQPGTTWTDEQLLEAVAPARVGRKLTPSSGRTARASPSCLTFDVDNESYLLARRRHVADHAFRGGFRRPDAACRAFWRCWIDIRSRPRSSSRR